MDYKVIVILDVSKEMFCVLNESAMKLEGLLLEPINHGLKGYFKNHLKIKSIQKENVICP
jgi:hypothetical protein